MHDLLDGHVTGLVSVEVSENGVDYSLSNLTFLYQEQVSIDSIQPSVIPSGQAVAFRIVGNNFLPGSVCALDSASALALDPKCLLHCFLRSQSLAPLLTTTRLALQIAPPYPPASTADYTSQYTTWISENEIVCQFTDGLPASADSGVRVSSNAQDFTESSGTLKVAGLWTVSKLLPHAGPLEGNTLVEVYGTGFEQSENLVCRFGIEAMPVAARFVSETLIECRTRPSTPGNVTLEVSINNQDFSSSGVTFEYLGSPAVNVLRPGFGPVGGGVLVEITGGPFWERSATLGTLYCRFGAEGYAKAMRINDKVIECLAPAHVAGEVPVEVSINGADYTDSRVTFAFINPTIRYIEPVLGPERGGTLLTLTGVNMVRGTSGFCRFGGVASSPAQWVSSTIMQCVTPPMTSGASTVSLLTQLSGNTALSSWAYEFHSAPRILLARPSVGPAAGGSTVMLVGAHFSQRAASLGYLRCRFNLTVAVAQYINSTAITCTSPAHTGDAGPMSLPSSIPLEMSNNAADFTASGVRYEYRGEVHLAKALPSSGPVSGGSLVTVEGENFVGGQTSCRFGSVVTSGTYVSDVAAMCMSPPHNGEDSLRVFVSISTNGVDFAESRIHFVYYASVQVTRLEPPQGPLQGRTLVAVHGTGFVQTASLKCRFDAAVVDAVFVSSTMVNCTTPAGPAGAVALEISNNGVDFSRSSMTYNYVSSVSVNLLVPAVGPQLGSSVISVLGTGMLPGSTCRFGGVAALAATMVSSGELRCVSPAQRQGSYPLEVTSNMQDFTSDGVEFRYALPAQVTHIEPVLGSLEGGTIVQVTGTGFVQNRDLVCRFGEGVLPVAAEWISDSQLECASLATAAAGNVSLEISFNNQDFSNSGVKFEYLRQPKVGLLSPGQGPIGGGTLVEVQGGPFWERSATLGNLYCRFGVLGVSRAKRVSDALIECLAPPHVAGDVPVEVSFNGLDFTEEGVTFAFMPPVIESIAPPFGPERGGTMLIVNGANMVRGAQAFCRFGSVASAPAEWVSATRMQCVAPPMTSGASTVSLLTRVDGKSALSVALSSWPYEYQMASTIYSFHPSMGPAAGGSTVMLVGAHFSQRAASLGYLRCRFNLTVAVAQYINSTAITCTSPAHTGDAGPMSLPSSIPLEMSNNAADFTASGVRYEYRGEVHLAKALPSSGPVSGGSLVTVEGENFVGGQTSCRFGSVVTSGTYVSDVAAMCMSPPHNGEDSLRVFVSISTNGVDFAESRIHFVYYASVQVTRLEPPQGPLQGRTLVAVHGTGFVQTASLKCRFDAAVVDAVFVSSTMVNCTTPAGPAGAVALEISNNGVDFSRSSMTYNYVSSVSVNLLVPAVGPQLGSSVISVLGTGMLPGSTCRFGGVAALAATMVSSGELRCVSPAQRQGSYPLEVTSNMQDFTSDGVEFRYALPAQVTHIEPVLGSLEGGTIVRVHGSAFMQGIGLVCRFGVGTVPTQARYISETQLECRSRAIETPANVSLEVSTNNLDFSSSGVGFEFLDSPAVHLLRPTRGPVGGGTLVEVQGGPFALRSAALGALYCRFGALGLSRAQLVSETIVECLAPPHVAGDVPVEVSLNGLDFSSSGLTFAFIGPTIQSVVPSLGPEQGGSVVTISADTFPSLGHTIYCFFGSAMSLAYTLSPTHIACVSPSSAPGRVPFHISFSSTLGSLSTPAAATAAASGAYEDGLSSPSVPYIYHAEPRVFAVVPSSGPNFGGGTVIVRGIHFVDANGAAGADDLPAVASLRCRYGRVVVAARYLNSTALACTAPRHVSSKVPLEVSNNGQDYTTSGVSYDFTSYAITRVEPAHGPILGGSNVIISLDTPPDNLELFCRFGQLATDQLVIASRSANSTTLVCKAPSHPPGLVELSLMALEDEAGATAQFEYVPEPVIHATTPSRALEAGLTPIYISGENFINSSSLTCAFGSARANATYISNSTILCVAPFYSGLDAAIDGLKSVQVRVATNGHDFSLSSTPFDFTVCPHGSFCSHLQILPCPPGGYCDVGNGGNFTACPPGTYQDSLGKGHCELCPIGFYCPSPGMPAPLPCAAGAVCMLPGLAYPSALCPPGHFCPSGVETLDPASMDFERRPIECPENTWCASGVASNISLPGNMSTPQPCLVGFVCFRGSDSPQGSGPCPTGYYCPPNSLPLECPPAHYCPGVGNVFPSQCTPGFYNDKYGRNQCIECPIGYICDSVGLSHPVLCPAGAVCNEPGLKVPAMTCPPGYFCWEGTETADWNAETDFKPIACRSSVYCLGGITNNSARGAQ